MAYMNREKKAAINEQLKRVMPKGWKYSLAVRDKLAIVLTIRSAPIDLIDDHRRALIKCGKDTYSADVARLEGWLRFDARSIFSDSQETIDAIMRALNHGNHDRSDVYTDYFDVGHYVEAQIGSWNKPFEVK